MQLKDIMIQKVITATPDMALLDAAQLLLAHDFDGVPVVNENNEVVGIMTQYDLLEKGSAVHLPTFQKIITEMQVYKKDKSSVEKDFKEVLELKVKDVMNADPLVLNQDANIVEVIGTFSEHHRVNPIPVIGDDNKLVGVVSRFDIMKNFIKTSEEVKRLLE